MSDIDRLIEQRDRAREQFATIGDMRPGSLNTNFTKCGNPSCHCAHDDAAKHGPYWILSRALEGQHKSVRLRPDEVALAQCQTDEYKRFHAVSLAFIRASEELAEARRMALRAGDPAKKKDSEAFAGQVAVALNTDIEALVGQGAFADGDFEAVERAARAAALQVAARLVAQYINADHSDKQGPRMACDCGHGAHYAGRRERTAITALGSVSLERAWYHCEACGTGFAPRDGVLGFDNGSLSPAVSRMVGIAASQVSFGMGSRFIDELASLRIDPKTVERQAEALGREVADDERGVIAPEPSDAPTLYVGLDGTGVPVRKTETEGRQGKQADGSARTREVKLMVVWSAEQHHPRTGRPMRDPGSASHNAAIESIASRDTDAEASPFARRVLLELERRRFDRAKRQVVLGDGTAWIWNFADEHVPDAIQIVDIFHAKQHVFDVARALYGQGSDLAAQWGKARRDELDQRRIDLVMAELRKHADHCEVAARNIDYFKSNRRRMDYPRFRAPGTVCLNRRGRGGMQVSHRRAPEERRNALECPGRQPHHRSAVRRSQQSIRRLLGTTGQSDPRHASQDCRTLNEGRSVLRPLSAPPSSLSARVRGRIPIGRHQARPDPWVHFHSSARRAGRAVRRWRHSWAAQAAAMSRAVANQTSGHDCIQAIMSRSSLNLEGRPVIWGCMTRSKSPPQAWISRNSSCQISRMWLLGNTGLGFLTEKSA